MNTLHIILILALIFAIIYIYPYFSQVGIEVSCIDKKILGFKRVPPPLLAVVQPEVCGVAIETKSDNVIVCMGNYKINSNTGVIPCDNLKEFVNKTVTIQAMFYDSIGRVLGDDEVISVYKGA